MDEPAEEPVNDFGWPKMTDAELERLLVERWVFRGALLVLMLAAAILTTYLGMQGAAAFWDRVAIGALVCLMVAAAAGLFALRSRDIRIHRELRRRRAASEP